MKKPTAEELLMIEGPQAHWTLKEYSDELACPDSRVFLLEEKEATRGFVLYRVFPDGIEIMNLAVQPKGQGWGTRLMEAFLRSLASTSELEIRLEVSSKNRAAMAFYEKFLFREFHRRARYYRDQSDAVLMKRTLP